MSKCRKERVAALSVAGMALDAGFSTAVSLPADATALQQLWRRARSRAFAVPSSMPAPACWALANERPSARTVEGAPGRVFDPSEAFFIKIAAGWVNFTHPAPRSPLLYMHKCGPCERQRMPLHGQEHARPGTRARTGLSAAAFTQAYMRTIPWRTAHSCKGHARAQATGSPAHSLADTAGRATGSRRSGSRLREGLAVGSRLRRFEFDPAREEFEPGRARVRDQGGVRKRGSTWAGNLPTLCAREARARSPSAWGSGGEGSR